MHFGFSSLSFHNKLKTNPRYLNHRINRCVDDLVQILLTIEEDFFHDRMRKEVWTIKNLPLGNSFHFFIFGLTIMNHP